MAQHEIICLANSRKHGGRCVAGLRVDGSGWLRPVGPLPDGILFPRHYTLRDGSQAAHLDVIRVGVRTHRPGLHHPENWVIDGTPWSLVSRPLSCELIGVLREALVKGPELLRGLTDRVCYTSFQQQPAMASLALVAPDSLLLYQKLSHDGRPHTRGIFPLGCNRRYSHYDLSVTDPIWEARVQREGECTLRQSSGRFVVTISLGEPFGGHCYKIVAAIILLPPALAAEL